MTIGECPLQQGMLVENHGTLGRVRRPGMYLVLGIREEVPSRNLKPYRHVHENVWVIRLLSPEGTISETYYRLDEIEELRETWKQIVI